MSDARNLLDGMKSAMLAEKDAGTLATTTEPEVDAAPEDAPPAEDPAPPADEPESVPEPEPVVAAPGEEAVTTEPERPSGEEPVPAAAVISAEDLAHAIKLAGGDSKEALALAAKRFNSNASELGRKNKALEEELAKLKTAPAPAAAAPAPAPTSATPAPAPVTAAPPPAGATYEEEHEKRVRTILNGDAEVLTASRQYKQSESRKASIATMDPKTGQPVGTLPTIKAQIFALYTKTTEGAKRFGVEPDPEYLQAELAARLEKLQDKERALHVEWDTLTVLSGQALSAIQRKRADAVQIVNSEYEAHEAETAEGDRINADRTAFAGEFETGFQAVMASSKITDEDLKADIWNRCLDAMGANGKLAYEARQDFPAFVSGFVKREMGKRDKALREHEAGRAAAARKNTTPMAPRGPAAVATPRADPNSSGNFTEGFVARYREAVGR